MHCQELMEDSVADQYVNILVQHSLIEMPDDFEPRFDDPRVGYLPCKHMTTTDAINYRDLVHR